MTRTPTTYSVGDRVILKNPPNRYERYRDRAGEVTTWTTEQHGRVVLSVHFDAQEGDTSMLVLTLMAGYFEKEPMAAKPKRRGPLNLKPTTDDRSEKQKQATGVDLLQSMGYVVMPMGQTSKPRPCPHCGTYIDVSAGGNTIGYPDLSIYHEHWGKGRNSIPVRLTEYKESETAHRGEEQKRIAAAGASTFVWSDLMLCRALYDFECEWIPHGPLPLLVQWLKAAGALLVIPARERL